MSSSPSQVIQELQRLIAETERGNNALYDAEIELADAESELDRVELKTFISKQGTVADRQALARLEVNELRLKRDLKRAERDRIKHKLRSIESAMTATQTIAKMVDLEIKGHA
jgi:hypothetical protein